MAATVTPEVLWAQRSSSSDASKNYIYLTISVPDVPKDNLRLDLKPAGLTFSGTSQSLKQSYKLDLDFYAEIKPEDSVIHHTAKNIEMMLQKKDLNDDYWPRLLKDSKKPHFLKTDFDKWADEDEQNEAADDDLSGFGGMGGMPGMGGDFGGIDFSKLGGGAGGMPDLSSMGMDAMPGLSSSGLPGEDDDADEADEDMPELEEAKGEATEKA